MENKPSHIPWWFYVIIICIAGILILSPDDKKSNLVSEALANIEVEKEKTPEELLKPALESINNFNSNDYKNSKENMLYEISLFEEWSKLTTLDIPESKELKTKLIALQKKEFPILRKAFGKIMRDVLWEENIEVAVNGTTITLTAGMYADNGSIKSSQDALSEIFQKFRFKRVNYKWYEYDDKYPYYTLSSKKDSEL